MSVEKFTNNDFIRAGIYDPLLVKKLSRIGKKLLKSPGMTKEEVIELFIDFVKAPSKTAQRHAVLKSLTTLMSAAQPEEPVVRKNTENPAAGNWDLREFALPFVTYGKEQIEDEAYRQMDTAMRLPVSVAGALMPDAHTGYGLPIGGVLATQANVVIPYAVGVDIACRMSMTVYSAPLLALEKKRDHLTKAIVNNTVFGVGGTNDRHIDTRLFDRRVWRKTRIIRELKEIAYRQFGTSGAGNHFVEWGTLEVNTEEALPGLAAGRYIALLSHSGSRNFGASVAEFYSGIARKKCDLPAEAKHLSWLELDSEEGEEYWTAMNLAGDYASENHREIHQKITNTLGWDVLLKIENHHNFAWKEKLNTGETVVVHRKGATPAGKENTGIIPGSMATRGFVIRGAGNPESLNSASHGAGRLMSRTRAIKTITQNDFDKMVKKAGITLIGGHVDEAPVVYKNIEKVMSLQKENVEILASFTPGIVRMADPERRRFR